MNPDNTIDDAEREGLRVRNDAKDAALTIRKRIRWYRSNAVTVLTEDERRELIAAEATFARINERLSQ